MISKSLFQNYCIRSIGLASIYFVGIACSHASPVNLNTWSAESYDSVSGFGNGTWNVSGSGDTVAQTVNGQPTLFYSDFNAYGIASTGKITVAASDDDYIGFVLGFNPGDSTNSAADYILIDWKSGTQTHDFNQPDDGPSVTADAGLAASRVTGIPTANEFWGHNDYTPNTSGGVEELARGATLGNTGWTAGQEYEFNFDFGPNNLVVSVDGVEQINLVGLFNDGRFGFYNFSQAGVTYSAFTVDEGSFAVPLPAGLPLLASSLGLGALLGFRRRRHEVA